MHKKFDNIAIEKKWQEKWKESGIYDVKERDESKEKEYVLVELPYPSGNLHIGHWHAFAVPDIYVRYQRMSGKQVVYPMGFDAFGLPAENAAIKRNIDPKEWTESNIAYMKNQLASMGAAFSWDKTASTIDPSYYKWTQWMFTEFFKKGIAYRGKGIVNWCPGCNTVIANEQVLANGTCERSGDIIEKKEMPQWMLKITDYADRLVDDLDALQWPEPIKEAQRRWIGRSKGAEINFMLSCGEAVTVFTTRPDTLFGATYLVLAPEHALIQKYADNISNFAEVEAYIKSATQKDEQDRLDATKEKTGVKLEGITATNPANEESIPVYVADYVLGSYGTGAIMAVPAHDERDFAFAQKFGLPIKQVIRQVFGDAHADAEDRIAAGAIVYDPKTNKYLVQYSHEFQKYSLIYGGLEKDEDYKDAAIRETYEETGYKAKFLKYISDEEEANFWHPGKKVYRHLIGRQVLLELVSPEQADVSEEELRKAEPVWLTETELKLKLTDRDDAAAVGRMFAHSIYAGVGNLCNSNEFNGMNSEEAKEKIVEKVGGKMTNTYRLRDWSVGRQRYWGVPIPIVYDPEGNPHAIPQEHLPWTLPEDVDFRPTGVAPLAKSEELKKRTKDIFGEGWTPEVETLDTFVDSSWYFLRYIDNGNTDSFASLEAQKNWMPIDMYFGGAEHTTMHLLYSRFWQKALFDLGYVTESEPYKRRINRGLVLGPDGNKMSKSKGNVIDPDDHVKTVGADSVKMYLAFMGPYAETANYPWDMGGIAGIRRFLERVYGLSEHIKEEESVSITKQLHKTIAKLREDIPQFKFNTAISAMMIFINQAEKEGITKATYKMFLKLLAPFAPHLTEELWEITGETDSIHLEKYPVAEENLLVDTETTLAVQINGKMRGSVTVSPDAPQEEVLKAIQSAAQFQKHLGGEIVKVIYVPKKIINLIVRE